MDLETIADLKDRFSLANLSKPALIGLVAILVMVAVAAGRLLIGTATANDFEISKAASSSAAAQPSSSSEAEYEPVFVHVSGEVSNPGLVELEAGSRVADAVNAAGGFTQDAETSSVNLARILSDGEQVTIARHVDQPEVQVSAGQVSGQAVPGSSAGAASGLVNINTASEAELVSLPGIGEATAAKIVSDRQANGAFKTIEDLKRVSGIGDKKFESLSALICV
ncbi:MAG: ComEA family DNA-binding protein [Eggerthellaceae bacterium]|nr:ComEA family DNA-binding protein [Eggerthellaceae bacterium]